ncbi:MAG: response regulator [Thermomicrobiales bacterium]|jgi:CheY-like chemotaxis protein
MARSDASHIVAINHAPEVLALLDDLLTEEGYRVTTRSHLDRDLQDLHDLEPDLIVIDYMWPTEDDNWALLQLIRLDPVIKAIPIILCTGAVAETRSMAEHLAQMQVHVVWKPFNLDDLLKAITGALERKPAEKVDPLP